MHMPPPFNTAMCLRAWLQIQEALRNGERPETPDVGALPGNAAAFSGLARYRALLERCWAQEPESRPSFSEVIDTLEELEKEAQGM